MAELIFPDKIIFQKKKTPFLSIITTGVFVINQNLINHKYVWEECLISISFQLYNSHILTYFAVKKELLRKPMVSNLYLA